MPCSGYQFYVTAVPPKLNVSPTLVGQEFGQGSAGRFFCFLWHQLELAADIQLAACLGWKVQDSFTHVPGTLVGIARRLGSAGLPPSPYGVRAPLTSASASCWDLDVVSQGLEREQGGSCSPLQGKAWNGHIITISLGSASRG